MADFALQYGSQARVQVSACQLDEPQPRVERSVPGNGAKRREGHGRHRPTAALSDDCRHQGAAGASALRFMAYGQFPEVQAIVERGAGRETDQTRVVVRNPYQTIPLVRTVEPGGRDRVINDVRLC